MVMFISHIESVNETLLEHLSHMADVKTAEYFMADAYVRVAVIMASAGTLLQT